MTKVLYCRSCGDIRAPEPSGKPTSCYCGTTHMWWVDPDKGTAKMFSYDRRQSWFIGLHNTYLLSATSGAGPITNWDWEAWRQLHTQVCHDHSDGYVFHKDRRNCWAAPAQPGWTEDVTWATYEEWTGDFPC